MNKKEDLIAVSESDLNWVLTTLATDLDISDQSMEALRKLRQIFINAEPVISTIERGGYE